MLWDRDDSLSSPALSVGKWELVLIGQGYDRAVLIARLDECLLTDEELAAGPAFWDSWEDPFHPWKE